MKKLFFLVAVLIIAFSAKAQDPIFVKGDKVVNLGIGLGSHPVVSASVDYCIADGIADVGSIGVGPYVGFGFGSHTTILLGGLRGTFHYPIIEDLDTYAGIGMGLSHWRWRYDSSYWGYNYNYNDTQVDAGFFLGARYGLSDNITVFGELGYGYTYLTAGIAFKF